MVILLCYPEWLSTQNKLKERLYVWKPGCTQHGNNTQKSNVDDFPHASFGGMAQEIQSVKELHAFTLR